MRARRSAFLRYRLAVPILYVHLLFVGVPLLLYAILIGIIWSGKSAKGLHPASYKMSDKWTHDPILWAAVDEKVGHAHGHGPTELTIGGGASGKW